MRGGRKLRCDPEFHDQQATFETKMWTENKNRSVWRGARKTHFGSVSDCLCAAAVFFPDRIRTAVNGQEIVFIFNDRPTPVLENLGSGLIKFDTRYTHVLMDWYRQSDEVSPFYSVAHRDQWFTRGVLRPLYQPFRDQKLCRGRQ